MRPELIGERVYLEDICFDDEDYGNYEGFFLIGGYTNYSCGCYYVLLSEDGRQIDGEDAWIEELYDDQTKPKRRVSSR